jgi:hypothetical protein
MKLKKLWERGHSGLYTIDNDRGGIVFHCWETVTSMPIGGFDASEINNQKKENVVQQDEDTTTWDVFVPFWSCAWLHWLNQWDVAVFCTPYGPFEVVSEWTGGGSDCYRAGATLPTGEVIESDDESTFSGASVAVAWEQAWANQEIGLGDEYMTFERRD